MSVKIVKHQSFEFWTESFGQSHHELLLLIHGGGVQEGIFWPDAFCKALARQNFFVVRYDNRNTSQSSEIDFNKAPYSLYEMSEDAAAIIAAYDYTKAHVLGASIGDAIGMLLAANHPDMVVKLNMMGCSPDFSVLIEALENHEINRNDLSLPAIDCLAWIKEMNSTASQSDKEKLKLYLKDWRILNGRKLPFESSLYRQLFKRSFQRSSSKKSLHAHIQAVKKSLEEKILDYVTIRIPTTIFHGSDDALYPLAHAKALAKGISQAEPVIVSGMGQNLNSAVCSDIISGIKYN